MERSDIVMLLTLLIFTKQCASQNLYGLSHLSPTTNPTTTTTTTKVAVDGRFGQLWGRWDQNPVRGWSLNEAPSQIPEPLTKKMCRKRKFSQLRACKMLLNPIRSFGLWSAANRYLYKSRDLWEPKSSERHIWKRSVNDCHAGSSEMSIVWAEEDGTGIEREVVSNPLNHLYQKIFVEQCSDQPIVANMECSQHKIKMKAAVWSETIPNDIEVVNIWTNAYCALSSTI